jgi:hypothetical protein
VAAKETPKPLSTTARQQLKISGILLSFQTPVCVFSIGKATDVKNVSHDALQAFYLLDNARQHVGKIWTCARIARMPRDHNFVALSLRKTGVELKDAVAWKYIPKHTVSTGGFADSEGGYYPGTTEEVADSVHNWKVINVMLVEWKNDVAFRVAVGQVISTAWKWRRKRLVYLG